MTRGRFVLIADAGTWMSIEFNGDMYPSYNGKLVYHMLKNISNYTALDAEIRRFDKERFGYMEMGEDICPIPVGKLDFSKDYFANFGSDYLYIKNASSQAVQIIGTKGEKVMIQPGEIQTWCYGSLVTEEENKPEAFPLDEEEWEFVKKIDSQGTADHQEKTGHQEQANFLGNIPNAKLTALLNCCNELLKYDTQETDNTQAALFAFARQLKKALEKSLHWRVS